MDSLTSDGTCPTGDVIVTSWPPCCQRIFVTFWLGSSLKIRPFISNSDKFRCIRTNFKLLFILFIIVNCNSVIFVPWSLQCSILTPWCTRRCCKENKDMIILLYSFRLVEVKCSHIGITLPGDTINCIDIFIKRIILNIVMRFHGIIQSVANQKSTRKINIITYVVDGCLGRLRLFL